MRFVASFQVNGKDYDELHEHAKKHLDFLMYGRGYQIVSIYASPALVTPAGEITLWRGDVEAVES